MKAMLVLGITMAVATVHACESAVTVVLVNPSAVPPITLVRAKAVAAGIFAGIGVELRWAGKDKAAGPGRVEVVLTVSAGPDDRPGSLAHAAVGPEADQRVRVYVDRLNAMLPPIDRGALLGHVLAHEITHILEGVARHSDNGVMKAHWEARELLDLSRHPLRFELVDEALIHAGLTQPGSTRSTRAGLAAAD